MAEPVRTLREWREDVWFLSQRELAERAGVGSSTVSQWESGLHRPQHRLRRKVAEAMGIKPAQILFMASRVKEVAVPSREHRVATSRA